MKFKKLRLAIPTITLAIIASQLMGCASNTQSELHHMIENGEQIEIEIAEPNFEIQGEETTITWTQLADLTTYPEFRKEFESTMGIFVESDLKQGVVYVDTKGNQTDNSTMYNAFMNSKFSSKWNSETVQSHLTEMIDKEYADLEESDYRAAMLNAYFNLLDDNTPNYFNGGASLSRAEAMTILMRAITPVEELKENETFKNLVGDSEYTSYAGYMDSNCFINSSDKSISKQTFNGTMTRAEFVYMVMNQTFGKEAVSKFDSSKVTLNDCKNAGNIANTNKFSGKDYCNVYVLNEMVDNPQAGVTEEIYKALAMAKEYGIISAETRWDEAITKTEGIEIIISAFEAKTSSDGHQTDTETGKVDEKVIKSEKDAKESYESLKNELTVSEGLFIIEFKDLVINHSFTKDEAIKELKDRYSVENETESAGETTTESETEPPTKITIEEHTKPEVQKPQENPTSSNKPQGAPLTLEEAYSLTPSGSYTEVEIELDRYDKATLESLGGSAVVRRTYKNGAIRDFMIVNGNANMLDTPWGSEISSSSSTTQPGFIVETGEKPTQPQKQESVYKGIFPPRANYSSDEEWVKEVNRITTEETDGYMMGNFFSSKEDSELFAKLHTSEGWDESKDLSFVDMSKEEWLKWCEENGFNVD